MCRATSDVRFVPIADITRLFDDRVHYAVGLVASGSPVPL